MFDGSSIEGFVRIEESDMRLYPDLDSFVIYPWTPKEHRIARLICNVYRPDHTPFEGDPRNVLIRALDHAAKMGYSFNVGPELEFFLFHTREDGSPTTHTHDAAGYFDLGPVDMGEEAVLPSVWPWRKWALRSKLRTMNVRQASMRSISNMPKP